MVSNESAKPQSNLLYKLAAVYGVFLGALLLAGSLGHIQGNWTNLAISSNLSMNAKLVLLFPGATLGITGLLNFLFFKALWRAKEKAQSITLVVNIIVSIYFARLLYQGIPDHPVGLFLTFSLYHVILLSAIQAGLSWPTKVQD